ncbi:hypothetical protein GETHLI_28650 [Geothrix limicola]|uniref:Uncharacterized protein n=1 Tax=Geothrix limicola TaxID=2927978 RepID=A0ABQ5QI54_9BACT|nr:hypothetical protein [Geothrix limicola]GLH74363.1 hypothetical protein GETHLI_28650 [Geothrix limicola]
MKLLRPIALGAALAAVPLMLALPMGCDRKSQTESTESKDLVGKVAEAEKAESQAQGAAKAQADAMAKAGLQPNAAGVQLTPAQRTLLEARVKDEKDNSTAALLQEILDRDKQIGELTAKVARLQSELPKPQIATEKDNHFAMAVRYLKGRGLSEEKAKTLAAKANIIEDLQPGWHVYHQYVGGTYLTAVTQGKAMIGPTEYLHNQRAALEHDRDDSLAKAKELNDQVVGLVAEKTKVQEEVDALRTEKTTLMSQVGELTNLSQAQKARLNSLHYLVGQRKQLEEEGVIVVPIFAKDRMGPKAVAARFVKDLPLDGPNPELQIQASDMGLTKISKVNVVPGSLVKNQHYTVTLAEDRKYATIRILDPERLRNDRVVFAVTD